MSNVSDRKTSLKGPDDIDVFGTDDFGVLEMAPDGVMRVRIVNGAIYSIHEDVTLPRLWWPKALSPTEVTTFRGSGVITLSVDGDDTPHIWGRDVATIIQESIIIVDASNAGAGLGTVLYDLVGTTDNLTFHVIEISIHSNFKSLGSFVDIGIIWNSILFSDNGGGVTTRQSQGVAVNSTVTVVRLDNSVTAPDTISAGLTFIDGPDSAIVSSVALQLRKPNNAFLHLDSGAGGNYNIFGNHYLGEPGAFFRGDVIATVTAQTDVSISIASFADSTADPGVDTTVVFAGIVDFIRGEVVLISGEAAYDGVHTIVRVADDQSSFDINVVHSTSGAATLDMVEHTITGVTKFVRGETVTIAGTTNYNGTHQLLRRGDASFTLPQAFVADEATGTATSSGKTQRSTNVFCNANVRQEDSKSSLGMCWNDNTLVTAVTDGVYTPLNLSGVLTDIDTERFVQSDAVTGEATYTGEKTLSGKVTFTMHSGLSISGSSTYRFALSVNQAFPVFATAPHATLDLRSAGDRVTGILGVVLDPGDDIRIMIAGEGTGVDLVVLEGSINI